MRQPLHSPYLQKPKLMKNMLLLLALPLVFTACSRTDDPTPGAGVVAIRLSNNTSWLGMPAIASVRDTPLRNPESGKVLWTSKLMSGQALMGPMAKGTRLYLSIQYTDVNHPNYMLPASGESIQADLLVDGKKVEGVLLDAGSFNVPANYMPVDATHTSLMREVAVDL